MSHLPKLSAGRSSRGAVGVAQAAHAGVPMDGVLAAQGHCRVCCGNCTGAKFWRRSCAPTCFGPGGSWSPAWCGQRFPFYRACTRICDSGVVTHFTRLCW